MAQMFGRKQVNTSTKPITADMATIMWPTGKGDWTVNAAVNIEITFQQPITRRRTIGSAGGSPVALLYPGQPQGQLSIGRMLTSATFLGDTGDKGWNACMTLPDITVAFDGTSNYENCTGSTGLNYICQGCLVESYRVAAESEGLTVMDTVVVQFLGLETGING